MFQLVRRSDTIPIQPFDFNRNLREVLEELINAKYANRVIADVGLVRKGLMCNCSRYFDLCPIPRSTC